MIDPVLSISCDEPEGLVVRHVRLCQLGFEKLAFLYSKLSQFDLLFNDHYPNSLENFIGAFLTIDTTQELTLRGLIWEVDEVGILFITNIVPGYEAKAHFTFWDRRIRGRERLVRKMADMVIRQLQLHRLYIEVPLYSEVTIKAVERMGFTKEGRLREVVRRNGTWYDANLYSLLEWEVEDGIPSAGHEGPE